MSLVSIDFKKNVGKVKPMHATNNGPVATLEDIKNGTFHPFRSNFEEFKQAGIPYARTHDTSFYHRFGLEHTVDVYYVFPNFDADPYDPNNYDFACTDHYLECCDLAGVEVFYRLGHRIELEVKKYGTNMPKDYKKWAIICEHIIRHYTEGWANGYKMKITYWEIWNEPDTNWNVDIVSPTWSGTYKDFFEFYDVVANHLKERFPHLKIGGPALAHDMEWAEMFLAQLNAPMDFFSWHIYKSKVEIITEKAKQVKALLEKYGFSNAESILNEWNYLRSWNADDVVYSHDHRGKIKGAAFSLAVMCGCQQAPVDMLMYYDARPNEFWNGMFDDTVVGRVLKGYYPFCMFNTLYRLGQCVESTSTDSDIYACAAHNGKSDGTILVTYFNDDDMAQAKSVSIDMTGFGCENGVQVEMFVLDNDRNMQSLGEATYYGERFTITLTVPNFTSYMLKLSKK